MRQSFTLLLLLIILAQARGQGTTGYARRSDSIRIYFRQGEATVDPAFHENGHKLEEFTRRLEALLGDSHCSVRGIRMTAGASPEGNSALNKKLAERRAGWLESYIGKRFPGREIPIHTHVPGIDWERLISLTREDTRVPLREEALDILQNTPEWITKGGVVTDGRKRRLGMLGGGRTWRYMEENLFPGLRSSFLRLWYDCHYPDTGRVAPADTLVVHRTDTTLVVRTDTVRMVQTDTVRVTLPPIGERKPLYMAVKTNLAYDALILPNIGLELYLGKGWSIAGNWMYTWFKNDNRHRYHRVYGGDMELRRWMSRERKPLTGHHMGVYAQMLTYDLEWGGKGYLGDRWSYGGGISYGYAAPIGRRLNLDFTLGIGYLAGEYFEYVPREGCYMWRATKNRRWFGTTKAEVSLVWLIGHGNLNTKRVKRNPVNGK